MKSQPGLLVDPFWDACFLVFFKFFFQVWTYYEEGGGYILHVCFCIFCILLHIKRVWCVYIMHMKRGGVYMHIMHIIHIWCLSDPLEFPMAPFSWGWTTSGSASCCYCSKFLQRPTLGYRGTSVLLFLRWKSTKTQEKQIIFNVLCIFYILYIFTYFA